MNIRFTHPNALHYNDGENRYYTLPEVVASITDGAKCDNGVLEAAQASVENASTLLGVVLDTLYVKEILTKEDIKKIIDTTYNKFEIV